MKIDRRLNIVIPLETDSGRVWVHSTPLSRAVFENYYRVIARAHAAIMSLGFSVFSGPRVAALELREAARTLGVWEGDGGVEQGLMPEIRRLTNVVMPDKEKGGWKTFPFQLVVDRKMLDAEDIAEAEGAVSFFMLVSAINPRAQLPSFLDGMARYWDAQIESWNSMEFASSLPTSLETDSSGETEPAPTETPTLLQAY